MECTKEGKEELAKDKSSPKMFVSSTIQPLFHFLLETN
jgi:hypothetical protein